MFAFLVMENEKTDKPGNPSGGCSMGCASFFVLVGIIWPLLHVVGGSYEPEVLFIPFFLGGPAFIVTHVLGFIAMRSQSSETQRWGKRAIRLAWGGIGFFLLTGVVGYLIDLVRGRP